MTELDARPNRILPILLVVSLGVALVLLILGSGPAGETPLADERASEVLAALGVATRVPTRVPTTPRAVNVATPRPTVPLIETPPPRVDHYMLRRPIASAHNDQVASFYLYGSRGGGAYPIHHGIEFVNPLGTPVLAAADGTVVFAGEDLHRVVGARSGFYGLAIIIEHADAWRGERVYTVYGHVSEVRVAEGERVQAGQTIGLVGEEGAAEGPHLHFEVRYAENAYGATVNPELWLEPQPGLGTLAAWIGTLDGEPLPELRVVIARASSPGVPYRELLTYPETQVNPDPSWGENLVVGDLPSGEWVLQIYHNGRHYEERFTVQPGVTSFLTVRVAS